MTDQETPQWRPLSWLPTIATAVDGMLEADHEQWDTLQEARDEPWRLDAALVARLIRVFTAQREDLALYDEQIRRWAFGNAPPAQRREIDRLESQLRALHQMNTDLLALAAELQTGTMEKQLAKSDAEWGLEFLLGGGPGHKHRPKK